MFLSHVHQCWTLELWQTSFFQWPVGGPLRLFLVGAAATIISVSCSFLIPGGRQQLLNSLDQTVVAELNTVGHLPYLVFPQLFRGFWKISIPSIKPLSAQDTWSNFFFFFFFLHENPQWYSYPSSLANIYPVAKNKNLGFILTPHFSLYIPHSIQQNIRLDFPPKYMLNLTLSHPKCSHFNEICLQNFFGIIYVIHQNVHKMAWSASSPLCPIA